MDYHDSSSEFESHFHGMVYVADRVGFGILVFLKFLPNSFHQNSFPKRSSLSGDFISYPSSPNVINSNLKQNALQSAFPGFMNLASESCIAAC